jgi:hypothetical protein
MSKTAYGAHIASSLASNAISFTGRYDSWNVKLPPPLHTQSKLMRGTLPPPWYNILLSPTFSDSTWQNYVVSTLGELLRLERPGFLSRDCTFLSPSKKNHFLGDRSLNLTTDLLYNLTPRTLYSRKRTRVPIQHEVGWASKPVWRLWRR